MIYKKNNAYVIYNKNGLYTIYMLIIYDEYYCLLFNYLCNKNTTITIKIFNLQYCIFNDSFIY